MASVFRQLGSKIKSAAASLGKKVQQGAKLGRKVLGKALETASDVVQKGAAAIGLDKAAENVADVIRDAVSKVEDKIPADARPLVAELYKEIGAKDLVRNVIFSADVVAGKEKVTEDLLYSKVPAYRKAVDAVDLSGKILEGDKKAIKKALSMALKEAIKQGKKYVPS